MKRFFLFLMTNLAVLVVISITLSLFNVNGYSTTGIALNYSHILLYCAVFGFIGSIFSLLISKWLAKITTGAILLEKPGNHYEQWLLSTLNIISKEAGLKTPQLAIFPSSDANAFATGWNKNSALIGVSQGLLDRFAPGEVKAVLSHEIGHIVSGDMVTLALLQGVVNTFVMFFARIVGAFFDKVVFRNERNEGIAYYITTIIAEIILGFLASSIVMWFSRTREFRADRIGAILGGSEMMIAALKKLKNETEAPSMPKSMISLGIHGPIKEGILRMFMSHPPLEERIRALRKNSQ